MPDETNLSAADCPHGAMGWCSDCQAKYGLLGTQTPGISGSLTLADLEAAYEKIWNDQYVPCGTKGKPHVVHPRDLAGDAPLICANCMNVVPRG